MSRRTEVTVKATPFDCSSAWRRRWRLDAMATAVAVCGVRRRRWWRFAALALPPSLSPSLLQELVTTVTSAVAATAVAAAAGIKRIQPGSRRDPDAVLLKSVRSLGPTPRFHVVNTGQSF